MENKTKYLLISFFFIMLLCVTVPFSFSADTNVNNTIEDTNTQTLKVLVIEQNPILETVQNTTLYKNNDGHPYVSEWFGQDKEASLNEVIEDIETTSHGTVNVEIVKTEYLNEFPKYTESLDTSVNIDGYTFTSDEMYSFDEELYVAMAKSKTETDKGDWYNFIMGDDLSNLAKNTSYSYDYQYLIDKYDLVNRRNNGEFDMVWINSIDPTYNYETVMVGSNAFWVNGTPIEADCKNFIFFNISISRRDANLHALGHGIENLMSYAFDGTYMPYGNSKDDSTTEKYQSLSLWQKFTMTTGESTTGYGGVGNVHYPFNALTDYDYSNTRKVYTNYQEWLNNYPNINYENKELANYTAWTQFSINTALGSDENKDNDRLYMRWWLYLFPHYAGYTVDGHYNNWWKYFVSNDYIVKVDMPDTYVMKVGNEITLDYDVTYYSGESTTLSTKDDTLNITSLSPNVVSISNGKLIANKVGTSIIRVYHDGVYDDTKVTVSEDISSVLDIECNNNSLKINEKTSCNIYITPNNTYNYNFTINSGNGLKLNNFKLNNTNVSGNVVNNNYDIKMNNYASDKKLVGTFDLTLINDDDLSLSLNGITTGTISNITLKEFNINDYYTVKFITNSDITIKDQYISKDGGKVSKVEDPTKEGYEFNGWYTDINYTNSYDFDENVTSNLTLYAKWTKVKWLVTFINNGHGNTLESVYVTPNEKLDKPTDLKDANYVFDGWYTDEECTKEYDFSKPVTSDLTLYAKWHSVNNPYTFDNTNFIIIFGMLSIVGITLILIYRNNL